MPCFRACPVSRPSADARGPQGVQTTDPRAAAIAADALGGCGPAGKVLWFTGLSGAGKSTIATLVAADLRAQRQPTVVLDGDDLRRGLNKDLGFSAADRAENMRRVGEVARLMADAGMTVVVALISPFRAHRARARALFAPGQFIEVFIDTPLALAEARDPKGLYRRARQGLLPGFTGIDSPYEAPEQPEISITTASMSAEQAAQRIVAVTLGRPGRVPGLPFGASGLSGPP
ncbi:MAG: adenylyl-sulfate kinase, partial [Chitinophagaceae bacterium]|nr:adenylyl-sulfate kinase [Rubrivivax sp.]